MTQDKSDPRATHSLRSHILPVLFALLMVSSIVAMPLASGFGVKAVDTGDNVQYQSFEPDRSLSLQTSGTEDNTSYYDDFEDGNATEWNSSAQLSVNTTNSFYGNNSLLIDDGTNADGDTTQALLEGGPTLSSQDSFEISGTYKTSGDSSGVWFGLAEGETTTVIDDKKTAMVSPDFDDDTITLSSTDEDGTIVDEVVIHNSAFQNTWMNYRIGFSNGQMRAKIWEAGTGEPDSWQGEIETLDFDSELWASVGRDDVNRQLYFDQYDLGGNEISGRVVDEDGNGVPNATVGGVGVNSGSINDTIEDKQAEAERLLEEAQNVDLPAEWNPDYDPMDQVDDSGKYLLAHEASDWGGTSQLVVDPGSSIDDPVLQVDGNEELVFSVWDGSKSGDWIENQYDGSYPGKIVEEEIKIEQFSPDGGTTNIGHFEPEVIAETSGGGPLGDYNQKQFYGVKRNLPTGIYRISRTGAPDSGYVIMVGSAEDQWSALETELKNEGNELTERAQELQGNIDSGLFERRTTTTDENGYYTLRMQTGVQKASIQAYRADGTILPAMTGPSFTDLREATNGDYNGTFDVSPPGTYDVPNENVTLETYRTDELPYQGIDSFSEFKNWIENQQLNESINELQSEYDQKFSELNRSQLEARYSTHRPLVETIPGAQERYLERSQFDSIQDAADLSNDELATEVGHMETVLSGMDQLEPSDDGTIDIGDGELNAEYPLPSGINEDTLQPEIHWSDGTSTTIPEEYWSVESAGTFGTSSKLVVEGYPIGSADPAAFDLRILGGGASGMLDDRLSALNPSFSGSIPDVRAIDVSTLSPGESERVSLTMRTGDDSNYGALESVEVIGPDGQELTASTDGDSATFDANGAGKHFVRATVSDTTGGQFVHTFQIRALEQGRQNPATVRAETAIGDRIFAIAGDGLDDAEIRSDAGQLEVDAIAPGGEIPSSVHIKPQAAMDTSATSIDVRVLEGSQEATVDSTVETVIHLDSLAEDAVVWRGEPGIFGEPLADGGTRYGEVMQRGGEDSDKVIIRTYSEPDGSVSLTINEQPGLWAGSEHTIAQWIPSFSLPFGLGMIAPAAGGGATVAGVVGLFARRRRLAR